MTARPWLQKATNEQIIAAYRDTGSVWSAGAKLGMAGQTVHERLRVIGYQLGRRAWTASEHAEMERLIANGVPLGDVAHRLGRTYGGIASRASLNGIRSVPKREKKLPRGAGFDKVSTEKHLRTLEQSGAKITHYARQEGLNIDMLVVAFQRHWPERWLAYADAHSPLPRKACIYCQAEFVPANTKQAYCTRDCTTRARADRQYFGGNRRNTIGLAEGVCQLCGRSDAKGLSSHHVYGKENDPENATLVALCPGCHQVVSHLGGRAFIDDPRALEALISLAWLRRHGPLVADGSIAGKALYVEVSLDLEGEDDESFGLAKR